MHLLTKLAELRHLFTLNSAAAAHRQQHGYNRCTKSQQFAPGDLVWLSIPTAGKLTPHWKGRWKVEEVKNNVNVKIINDYQSKVVHDNRLRHRLRPSLDNTYLSDNNQAIDIEHLIAPEPTPPSRRYPD